MSVYSILILAALAVTASACANTDKSVGDRNGAHATKAQCDAVAANYAALVAKENEAESPMEGAGEDAKEIQEAVSKDAAAQTRAFCLKHFDRKQAICAGQSKTLEEMMACRPEVDFRAPADRPNARECEALAAHVHSITAAAVARMPEDAENGDDFDMAEHMSQGALRECQTTMSKKLYACYVKAPGMAEYAACAKIEHLAVDQLVEEKLVAPMEEVLIESE